MRRLTWTNQYVFFTLISVLKLYLVRIILYKDYNVMRAVGLELAPLLLLYSVAEVAGRKFKSIIYLAVSFLFSSILLALILYYEQFGRIINYESIYLISYVGHVQASLKELFSYWYLVFYLDLVVVFLLLFVKRHPFRSASGLGVVKFVALLFVALLLSGFNIYEHRASRINITQFAQAAGIMNAEGVQVYHELKQSWAAGHVGTVTQSDIEACRRIDGDEAQPRWKGISTEPRFFGSARGKNLIVVQLESFQNFLLGLKVEGQEITPNLNRLAQGSLVFSHFYSQIGQGNTSDAEFIFNTSLYPLENGAISSSYPNKDFPSLPKVLREHGYASFTFHGNDLSFWNRKELYAGLGYDRAYDKQFFGEEEILGMGPSDQVLFRKALPVLTEAQRQGQTFYANFITLTCHHPYILPPERLDLTLPKELEGTLTGNYLKSSHYVDEAIGEFIEGLKQAGLWADSVMVFYGDHFGLNAWKLDKGEEKILQKILGRSYDEIEMFHIPLLIRVPGLLGEVVTQSGGQVDALPTLANLLGVNLADQVHFGVDLLNARQNIFPLRFYFPEGSFINDEGLFRADSKKARKLETRDEFELPGGYQSEEKKVHDLMYLSDAYLRNLPERSKVGDVFMRGS
ncbi:MAG: LTA synthase family protein [Desulfitobacteriaceae bacterium]|nr:LTA synthase family protein [Desulfitobacteriaceae bacterium]MDI6915417.1 LTA synthase family protein [Desulfitobacteriaceae bacterium]